jgi:hypothetical protein
MSAVDVRRDSGVVVGAGKALRPVPPPQFVPPLRVQRPPAVVPGARILEQPIAEPGRAAAGRAGQ